MQVGVVAAAGGGEVADDGFVLHAPQRDNRQGHRVDDGGGMADFAPVALRVPAVTAFGDVVVIVVEERRQGIVEAVDVVEGDAHGAACGGEAADKGRRGGQQRAEYRQRAHVQSGFSGRKSRGEQPR